MHRHHDQQPGDSDSDEPAAVVDHRDRVAAASVALARLGQAGHQKRVARAQPVASARHPQGQHPDQQHQHHVVVYQLGPGSEPPYSKHAQNNPHERALALALANTGTARGHCAQRVHDAVADAGARQSEDEPDQDDESGERDLAVVELVVGRLVVHVACSSGCLAAVSADYER